ncbi:MAG: guanylate kinase [Anaerolineae bacterium]|nr:guanylate kinase [Anaerolineae bacterium]
MMVSAYPGILFTLVGPAGAGKNTVMGRVLATRAHVRQFPTMTTRSKRTGEFEGRQHYFVSHERFEEMLRQGELLEHALVHGEYYGMPRAPLETALRQGELLLADVDMLGAQAARAAFPDNVILVFVQPPSLSALVERMRESRGENEAQIGRRLLRAPSAMAFAPQCDYIITNEELDHAADELVAIITAELARRIPQQLADQPLRPLCTDACSVIVYHDQAVVTAGSLTLPHEAFAIEALPHLAALQAAAQALTHAPTEAALTTAQEATDGYIPPVYVEDLSTDSEDHFRYHYVLRLMSLAETMPGYQWVDLASIALPEPVRDAISEPAISDGL